MGHQCSRPVEQTKPRMSSFSSVCPYPVKGGCEQVAEVDERGLESAMRTARATRLTWGVTAREARGAPGKVGTKHRRTRTTTTRVSAWAGAVEPAKADMDRFAVCVRVTEAKTVVTAAVCDGHGISKQKNWGADVATKAVKELTEAWAEDDQDSLEAAFLEFQKRHEEKYDREVATPVQEARAQFEKEHGFSAGPLALPAEGGTTATVVRVENDALTVAWVGDSRCVLAVRQGFDFKAIPLTQDHNVDRNPEERARCEAAGGQVIGKFLAGAGDADGMLQVTRSLGDREHHRADVVLAKPQVASRVLGPDAGFLIMASDGLWDHCDDQAVVDAVALELATAQSPDRLFTAATTLIQNALENARLHRHKPDDVSCLVLLFDSAFVGRESEVATHQSPPLAAQPLDGPREQTSTSSLALTLGSDLVPSPRRSSSESSSRQVSTDTRTVAAPQQ